jgi:hypothetical protein
MTAQEHLKGKDMTPNTPQNRHRATSAGYPILEPGPIPNELVAHARQAVAKCPVLALRLLVARDQR